MAFVKNCAFEHRIGDRHEADNITGRYQANSADALCNAGHLVIRGNRKLNEGYGTGVYNENAYVVTDALAATVATTPIYACNPYDVSLVHDGVTGGNFAIGANTLGIPAPEGRDATYTLIRFNERDIYRFGVGNLSATLSTNLYLTIANGQLVPAAAAPTTAGLPYFKVVGTGNFTEGNQQGGGYVDVVGYVSVASGN